MKTTIVALFASLIIVTTGATAAHNNQQLTEQSVTVATTQYRLIAGNDGLERSRRFYEQHRMGAMAECA